MRRFSRIEFIEPCYSPSLSVRETAIFKPRPLSFPSFFEEEHDLSFTFDLLTPKPCPLDIFDTVTDLVQIDNTPSLYYYKRVHKTFTPEFALETLCDRVSALESRFDRLVNATAYGGERKYTWTAEIEGGPVERKYKWTAEIKEGTSGGDAGECSRSEKKGKKDKKEGENNTRVVEIEEPGDHGALVLRQRKAFSKRPGAVRNIRGKNKELSPQDAAIMIQMTFRAYLIRRSQALRALRDLAVAKTKLKEIRALFNNLSYRRQVARDAEERQRFSEKIIVLLLTVDAIEGADPMVRAAKRSMVDELETMLDTVDPQPAVRSLSIRKRTFDMPDKVIQKEIAAGVAQVVKMIDEEKGAGTFEACI
ncbi:BAG family molecular chaperone regulator 7-like [Mangifera indica]|uniref:BAG family molecular chaperone regulator 7-like n=1 Tax=Mangifera indica TaxID=29780 RepID=UPI001CFA894E|nr:BAG family molecular chaperone regulator 7-like [Mangifera indica]